MSDPQPDRLKPRPRRAPPLQPDKLGGVGAEPEAEVSAEALQQAAAMRKREQAATALENLRDGYS